MEDLQKEFVPYELAVKLKAIGFKERALTYYEDGRPKLHNDITGWDFNSSFLNCVSRPTFSQAFKWFREVHDLLGIPTHSKYTIMSNKWVGQPLYGNYNSYEEAELACLQKLLEIVESKPK
jgi:hypothetical protein